MKALLTGLVATKGTIVALALLGGGTAPAQSSGCLDSDCFYDRQVRDFRVIDSETVIVYVGSERCPFLVKTQGFYCDLKYIPDIDFFHERRRRMDVVTGTRSPVQRGFRIPGEDNFASNDRICTNNAAMFALETFGFGLFTEDEVPQNQVECPVASVTRITDDDLVELYTEQGMPPPPPIGNGTISRSSDADEADD